MKNLYYKSQFIPNFLFLFVNPSFFIRKGLYNFINRYAPKMNGSILDFGCGRKPYKELFINCTKYVGLDIKLNEDSERNVFADIYYQGNKFPIENETFDNIFSSEALELISNPDEILGEINRVLRPEGYFLLTVPFVWEEHWLPYDFCRYSSSGIRTLLERNGFAIIEQHKSTTYFETAWQLLIFYIYQNIFPKKKIMRLLFTIIFITPLNILGWLFNWLLPNNREHLLFHNNIVWAKKI